MDNVNDWLYIVFLIIAGVSGLFSSGKKKKHSKEILGNPGNDAPAETNTTQEKGFWEILQEMQTEKPQPKPRLPKITIHKKQKPTVAAPAPTPFLSGETNISARQPIASTSLLTEQNDEENNILSEQSFTDTNELRKAIIYSEILNRKY